MLSDNDVFFVCKVLFLPLTMNVRLLGRIRLDLYFRRSLSNNFITTPIYYVNATPHIGHLYTSLLADCFHRYELLCSSSEGIFSTGTDEHGTKVQQSAASSGLPLQKYCDKISSEYKYLFDKFEIGYTSFIRTTDLRHKEKVQQYWKLLAEKGFIEKGTYSGWYCDADEAFLTESQISYIKLDGKDVPISEESGRPVHWVEETNYKFDLPKFKEKVRKWINTDGSIRPKKFQDLCNVWLDEGLMDRPLSISRPKKRVHWSIQVPGDEEQTVYVWLDALINYLTVGENRWPPQRQIIGKDILKFHGIYWPAFLAALGLEMPKSLLVHSHWTVEGEKMSKSKGNVVDPLKCVERFGVSGLRYFLLREGTPHSDSNYSDVKIFRVLNSELADTLGNLLSRTTGKAVNKSQTFPSFNQKNFDLYCREEASELVNLLNELKDTVGTHYDDFNFYKGIAAIMSALHSANRFVESSKPWELSKIPSSSSHLDTVLHLSLETLRICGIALTPVIPSLMDTLLNKLNVPEDERMWKDMVPSWSRKFDGNKLSEEKVILYSRLQT